MNGRMDGRMNGRLGGRMVFVNGWMNGWIYRLWIIKTIACFRLTAIVATLRDIQRLTSRAKLPASLHSPLVTSLHPSLPASVHPPLSASIPTSTTASMPVSLHPYLHLCVRLYPSVRRRDG